MKNKEGIKFNLFFYSPFNNFMFSKELKSIKYSSIRKYNVKSINDLDKQLHKF